jgi:hypothetical protein
LTKNNLDRINAERATIQEVDNEDSSSQALGSSKDHDSMEDESDSESHYNKEDAKYQQEELAEACKNCKARKK